MDDNQPEPRRRPSLRTTRMEAFSDGVFAIAITLLVLQIGVEVGADDHLLKALADQWPSYVAYLISFSTIGAVWIKHTVITEYLVSTTPVLIRLNLLLLMVVSFLPFPTGLVAEHINMHDAERVATTVYGMNLLLASSLLGALWRYAVRSRLIRADTTDAEVTALSKQFVPSLAGYVVMLVVGLFVPLLAVLGYLAIAVYIILPLSAIWPRGPRS
ncbi:TMEM175 family protein [Mycolicibacterium sp. XJ879]